MPPQTVLLILDGFGVNSDPTGNAILNATTPNLDYLWNNYPHTLLKAAEEEVGLSFGEMGNSEVGHLSLGSGRVLYQSLPRITAAINDRSFYQNAAFLQATNHVKKNQSALHLLGMISVSGVHAHLNHLIALIKLASEQHVAKLYLHLILDGRDSGPKDAPMFLKTVREAMRLYNLGAIATISGRAFAMDRNHNWERTQTAFDTLFGKGKTGTIPEAVIQENYQSALDDENLPPTVIVDTQNRPLGALKDNDALIFFNFREDRARQLTSLLVKTPVFIVTMTQYDHQLPCPVAFPPQDLSQTLSDVLFENGIPQLHIAETEKYAHVTYFFNGGREIPHETEKYLQITSPKPETFATHPEMAAAEVASAVIQALEVNWPFIIVNFANPDMVGHTGDLKATVAGINFIDNLIGQIFQQVKAKNGLLFLTSDHGNCESKIDPMSHNATKDHTTAPVPFIFANSVGAHHDAPTLPSRITQNSTVTGLLADVAPTILNALNLPIPAEMTGSPLF